MPRALIFDVFGTCVDWRGSIARQVARAIPGADPAAFADAWRAGYDPAMAPVRDGRRAYVALDDLHAETLRAACARFGVAAPDDFARAWERLDPWPDTVPGLTALRRHRIIAPCSNGSIALMTRLARHAGLPWDCILGADLAQSYKPDPAVYLASAAALRLAPHEVMMVAAHTRDLQAAAAAGLRTAFIPRPAEHGPGQTSDLAPTGPWDIAAADMTDLARQLEPRP